jgi:hypothetical protein
VPNHSHKTIDIRREARPAALMVNQNRSDSFQYMLIFSPCGSLSTLSKCLTELKELPLCGETLARVAAKSPWVGRHVVSKKPLPIGQDECLGAAPAES